MRNRARDDRGRGWGHRPDAQDERRGEDQARLAHRGTDNGQPWATSDRSRAEEGWRGRGPGQQPGPGYGGPVSGVRPWEELEGSGPSHDDGGPYGNPQYAGRPGYGGRFEGQSRGGGYRPGFEDREENLRRGFGMSPYGGYAQSGYSPGSQSGWGSWSPQRGRGPKGYQRSDQRIREDICDAVIDSGIDAGEVDVRVESAQVTLSGTVEHKYQKRHIEDIAESVAGVKEVDNQIRVGMPPRSSSDQQSGELGGNSGSAGGATNGGQAHSSGPSARR
jgi:hypothetical protein